MGDGEPVVPPIRFEHFQHSTFMGEADTFLIFRCSQGQAHKQGVRPPCLTCFSGEPAC